MAVDIYNRFRIFKLRKLKSFLISKDVLSFFVFFLLSALFWFVNALDKNREITFNVPLQLKNLPEEIAITNNLPEFITVNVRDVGHKLFTYSDKKLKPLSISMSNYRFVQQGKIQIDAATLNRYLQSYLLPSTSILSIRPDSLLIAYERLHEKKIPVKILAQFETKPQFMVAGEVLINPAFITVYGPKNIIDSLRWIETESVSLNNLNDTTFLNLKLKPIPFVKPETSSVKVVVPICLFTEKSIELPVEAVNFPSKVKIKSFPAFVKVTVNVAISDFKKFKSSDIQVYIDYNDIKNTKNSKYILKIKNKNQNLNNIRLSPSEVEFILEQT